MMKNFSCNEVLNIKFEITILQLNPLLCVVSVVLFLRGYLANGSTGFGVPRVLSRRYIRTMKDIAMALNRLLQIILALYFYLASEPK